MDTNMRNKSRITYKDIIDSDYQMGDLLLRDHYWGFTEVELEYYIDNCEIARIVYAEKFSKLAKAIEKAKK